MTGDHNGEDPNISSPSFDSIHYGDRGIITEEGESHVRIQYEWKYVSVISDDATWYDNDEIRLYLYIDFARYTIRKFKMRYKANNETFGAHVLEKLYIITETTAKEFTVDSEIMDQNRYFIFLTAYFYSRYIMSKMARYVRVIHPTSWGEQYMYRYVYDTKLLHRIRYV